MSVVDPPGWTDGNLRADSITVYVAYKKQVQTESGHFEWEISNVPLACQTLLRTITMKQYGWQQNLIHLNLRARLL